MFDSFNRLHLISNGSGTFCGHGIRSAKTFGTVNHVMLMKHEAPDVLQMNPRIHVGSDSLRSLGRLPVSKRVEQIILNHVLRLSLVYSAYILFSQVLFMHMELDLETLDALLSKGQKVWKRLVCL